MCSVKFGSSIILDMPVVTASVCHQQAATSDPVRELNIIGPRIYANHFSTVSYTCLSHQTTQVAQVPKRWGTTCPSEMPQVGKSSVYSCKDNKTRSSATAEKQRVSCPHGRGATMPSSPLSHRPLWLHGTPMRMVESQTRNKRTSSGRPLSAL